MVPRDPMARPSDGKSVWGLCEQCRLTVNFSQFTAERHHRQKDEVFDNLV
jgi:hypothetical protein